ncbi:MAG: hypothetical protein K0U36_04900 [Alphaproteobacteria bacterium]|nr:hypothetical protein [Alphaproteobacteria bacterium]
MSLPLYSFLDPTASVPLLVKANATIFRGTAVRCNSAGYIDSNATSGDRLLGVATSYAVGGPNDGDTTVNVVFEGLFTFNNFVSSDTKQRFKRNRDENKYAYLKDNQTVSPLFSTDNLVGRVVSISEDEKTIFVFLSSRLKFTV